MSQSETLDSLSALLECPVCLESFTDPRMLTDCFHTLCYKCLFDHIEHFGQGGQFECPVCRASVEVPDDGAGFFPKNFFMNSFLAALTKARVGLESAATEEQHKVRHDLCSNWEDGSDCTEPEHFCTICCEYYCKSCTRAHRKLKLSRHHELIAVDGLNDEVLREATLKREAPRCLKHNKKLKFYCSTCKCAVCSTCCPTSHQSHIFREMADVDDELKEGLRKLLTDLKQLIDKAKTQTDQINKQEVSNDQNTADGRETAKCLIQKMQRMIDLKGQEIDQKLCQMHAEARSKTGAQSKQITLYVEQLENLQSFVFDLLDKGSAFNRLASMPEVERNLHKLKDFPPKVSTVVQTKSQLLRNTVDNIVLEEEVPLDEESSSLKIRQKCCITPDKVDGVVQTEKPTYTNKTAVDKVFGVVRFLRHPAICLAWIVIGVMVSLILLTRRPTLDRQRTGIRLSRHVNEATIDWSVNNLHLCTLVLVIVCEKSTNNCVTNFQRSVSKSSVVSVPQGSAYIFSFHFYYGSGLVDMHENVKSVSSELKVQQYGYTSPAVKEAARSLSKSLRCDVQLAYGGLQDVPKHHPQVDIIICLDDEVNSVIGKYNLNKQNTEMRHLVLLHVTSGGGTVEDTVRRLGINQVLFKRVVHYVHSSRGYGTSDAAVTSLASYFLEVSGQGRTT